MTALENEGRVYSWNGGASMERRGPQNEGRLSRGPEKVSIERRGRGTHGRPQGGFENGLRASARRLKARLERTSVLLGVSQAAGAHFDAPCLHDNLDLRRVDRAREVGVCRRVKKRLSEGGRRTDLVVAPVQLDELLPQKFAWSRVNWRQRERANRPAARGSAPPVYSGKCSLSGLTRNLARNKSTCGQSGQARWGE